MFRKQLTPEIGYHAAITVLFFSQGDAKAGFSIFWADDGLDTGPILLQKSTDVQPNDTVDSLYNRFMFPEGLLDTVFTLIIKIKQRQTFFIIHDSVAQSKV